ncbi:hypothetical protein ACTXT7_013129 [Hymenolepis weldensis]
MHRPSCQAWNGLVFYEIQNIGKHLIAEPVKYEEDRVELENEVVATIVVQKGKCSHCHQFAEITAIADKKIVGFSRSPVCWS